MPTMSIIREKKALKAANPPRANVVSGLLALAPISLGVLITALTANPIAAILGVLLGVIAAQAPRL